MIEQGEQESIIPPFPTQFRTVLLFGPAGSGKGTMGSILAQAGSMCHISSGDIFRSLSPTSPAGILSQKYVNQGILVPDEVTIEIWRYYVNGLIATNRFLPDQQILLLDGLPRTLAQANMISSYMDLQHVIVLDIDDTDELIVRLQRRAKIEGRADDANADVLKKRLDLYRNTTVEILNHFPSDKISRFNAAQKPLNVLRDILSKLSDTLSTAARPLAMPSVR